MAFFIIIAFIGFLAGIFLLLKMTPFEFLQALTKFLPVKRKNIAKQINEARHPKEPKGIQKTIRETKEVLKLTGKSEKFTSLCALAFFLFVVGILFCVLISNFFMMPVLAVGLAMLPFWYVIFTSHSYKKMMNGEVETALSVITTSYTLREKVHKPRNKVIRSAPGKRVNLLVYILAHRS